MKAVQFLSLVAIVLLAPHIHEMVAVGIALIAIGFALIIFSRE